MGGANFKICFLSYKKLTRIVENVIDKTTFAGTEFLILDDCTPENLAGQIDYALLNGCEAFIAGSANAAEFRRISQEQLTEIRIHPIDYVLAVKKALSIGKRPVIYTYQFAKVPDLSFLDDIFDCHINHVIYEDTYDLTESLERTDADVIIGSSMVNDIAESLSLKTVMLYVGSSAIEDAIHMCRRTVKYNRKLQGMQEMYRELLISQSAGIIGVNEEDRVVLYNEQAAHITGIHQRQVQGQKASAIFPWAKLEDVVKTASPLSRIQRRIGGNMIDVEYRRVNISRDTVGMLMVLSKKEGEHTIISVPALAPAQFGWTFADFSSSSKAMGDIMAKAVSYCDNDFPMIISGESGTGKSLMAISIHNYRKSSAPLEFVNCSVIDDRFIGQYFFGREDGCTEKVIYTGVLERCAGGTIILQNIQSTTAGFQRNLSLAVRSHSFKRINGESSIRLNTRIITMTHDSSAEVAGRNMDRSLFFALSVLKLEMPPLRERAEDVPNMFKNTVNKSLQQGELRSVKLLSPILTVYSWPGNINELSCIAQRFSAIISSSGNAIGTSQQKALIAAIGEERLWEDIIKTSGGTEAILASRRKMLEFLEKAKDALLYNNSVVAEKLGISRTTLWRLTKD